MFKFGKFEHYINREVAMNCNKDNKVPQSATEYKIKYVFKENSNVDINEVIKESFVAKLRTQKITQ